MGPVACFLLFKIIHWCYVVVVFVCFVFFITLHHFHIQLSVVVNDFLQFTTVVANQSAHTHQQQRACYYTDVCVCVFVHTSLYVYVQAIWMFFFYFASPCHSQFVFLSDRTYWERLYPVIKNIQLSCSILRSKKKSSRKLFPSLICLRITP